MFTTAKLGKCLTRDTRVLLADGRYERIEAIQDGGTIVAFDGRGFVPMPARWVAQGRKRIVGVRTRLGREIATTWRHPYLTPGGWREVRDLDVGDRIAVPTHLPYFGDVDVAEHESALLGLWLAEGASRLSSVKITTTTYGEQVAAWAREWGCEAHQVEHREGKAPTYQVVAGPRGGRLSNPIIDRLRALGLGDCRADSKHVPAEVFTWRREHVATLLRWLFNGDGWLADLRRSGRSGFQLGFASASQRLVRDVSHLLLRFGIVGRVRKRADSQTWTWEINRYREVRRFVDLIGIDRPAAALVPEHEPEKQRASWGVVEFDRIVAIGEEGEEEVYDLIVDGLGNFVADDVVAHNTDSSSSHRRSSTSSRSRRRRASSSARSRLSSRA